MRVESVVEESVSCAGPRSARDELDDRTGMPEMLFARSAEHIKIRSENSGKAASKLPVRTYRSDAGGRGVMARAGDFGREVRHKFPDFAVKTAETEFTTEFAEDTEMEGYCFPTISIALTRARSTSSPQCKWGPVTRPVAPTLPITSPTFTSSPTFASI